MKKAILFMSLLCAMQFCYAWGKTGHRVVGQIAETHLNRKAKRAVAKLLGTQNLAHVSNFMDEVKSRRPYDHTHTWHYANVDSGKTYHSMEKNPKGDVVSAIEEMKSILQNKSKSKQEKAEALKFLVHLVGDIHQPFHVGRANDWGGNKVSCMWFHEKSNIHRVWDENMIDFYQMSYTELANEINHGSRTQIKAWQAASTVDMLTESHEIVRELYTQVPQKLSYAYMDQNFPIVKERLLLAGVRLAGILNAILG